MAWLAHLFGLDPGYPQAFWSGFGGDLAIVGGLAHLVRQHAHIRRHAAATHRIMADMYHHHTGRKHPEAPCPHTACTSTTTGASKATPG